MNLDDLKASLSPTPGEPRKKRIGATTDSIALIASNGGKGVILVHDGSGIEADIEALGIGQLDDHGLDGAPDGLSIWEGRLISNTTNTPGGLDYDTELDGVFRALTEREWELYRTTGIAWEFETEASILAAAEVFYFGCGEEAGHYWFASGWKRVGRKVESVLPALARSIDQDLCPGFAHGRREENVGHARLTHAEGWTFLSWWDRSVDPRTGSNSNLVAKGRFRLEDMLTLARDQFPGLIDRQLIPIAVVETRVFA